MSTPGWPFGPAAVLPVDGFDVPQSKPVSVDRGNRIEAPDTFDVDRFVATLTAIRHDNGPVTIPGSGRSQEDPVPPAVTITPEIRVVIVEGNHLLHDRDCWERARPLLDRAYLLDSSNTAPDQLHRMMSSTED
jgi:pantothenate kinase